MKLSRIFSALIFLSALQSFSLSAFSLDASSWQHRQAFDVAAAQSAAGPMRVAVPLETLDRLQADLRDLRLLGPDGGEVPFAILPAPPSRASQTQAISSARRSADMRLDSEKREISVEIETGTDDPLESVELQVADTKDYMLPARVEFSADGKRWESIGAGWPLFRRNQSGTRYDAVVENTFRFNGHVTASRIRVTIPADETQLAITGAIVRSRKKTEPRPAAFWETARAEITAREETPGESRITVDLGAANLSVNWLAPDIADPLFLRHATITAGDERIAGNGDLYRFAIDEHTPAESTRINLLGAQVRTRCVILRIDNGDSPPLRVRGVTLAYRSAHIVFNPSASGRYVFLSGNAQASAPRYDLAAMSAKFERLPLSKITAAEIAATPDYRAPAPPKESLNLASRALFWIALAAVVIVLLTVVAKLLPKTKE